MSCYLRFVTGRERKKRERERERGIERKEKLERERERVIERGVGSGHTPVLMVLTALWEGKGRK